MTRRKHRINESCAEVVRGWMLVGGMFLGLSWGCTSAGLMDASNLPVGVVNPQRILQETDKGQRLTDTLNAFMKDRQALVELEQRELRKLESELMAQSTVLSQPARERKEEQFRQKMGLYQQKVTELNQEVQEKQRELQDEFRLQVQKVVAEIASQRGLGVVLEHGANSGTLFYHQDLDISPEVIQAMNQGGNKERSP
jgi:outer membrane protein